MPKTLFIDIETFPHLGYTWGMYEQNVIEIIKPGYLLCVAYSWAGEGVHTIALRDFKGYKGGSSKEKQLVEKVWDLFDEADVIVTQNGDAFDIPEMNARFIKYGLNPPSHYEKVDTKKMSKRVARLPSHSLDYKSKFYGHGRKLTHVGIEMWFGCDRGEKKHWDTMLAYNVHDVDLLISDYNTFAPWVKLPNRHFITNDGLTCPRPTCDGKLMKRGKNGRNLSSEYQRYQCKKCGGWCRGNNEKSEKIEVRA